MSARGTGTGIYDAPEVLAMAFRLAAEGARVGT